MRAIDETTANVNDYDGLTTAGPLAELADATDSKSSVAEADNLFSLPKLEQTPDDQPKRRPSRFITPPSEKAERTRAQGLVNKRLRLGWFARPETCARCSRRRKVDFHHPDYHQPDMGHWLCRRCHTLSHYVPDMLHDLPPVRLERQTPKPPRHRKGGRKGPTGTAKGRAPLTTIKGHTLLPGGMLAEHLACGHDFIRPSDDKLRVQRRCLSCRDTSPAAALALGHLASGHQHIGGSK